MADTFKSFTIDLNTTGERTLYTCPSGDDTATPKTLPTTAIVKSLIVANDTASTTSSITVNYEDSSNSNFKARIFKADIGADVETDVLTNPLVMESGDKILLTAGTQDCLHAILSVLEIT